jgi:hypothetical protein
MDAVQRYGWKDVKSIAQHVGTRTPTQVRTHAQKLFLRQQKEQTGARWQRTRVASTDRPLEARLTPTLYSRRDHAASQERAHRHAAGGGSA